MKRHHQPSAANTWDHDDGARGACVPDLNRFTRNLIVMYASSARGKVFHVNPEDNIGKPILLYIRADDLAPFVEQDLVKHQH
jgi:hypothetical protein